MREEGEAAGRKRVGGRGFAPSLFISSSNATSSSVQHNRIKFRSISAQLTSVDITLGGCVIHLLSANRRQDNEGRECCSTYVRTETGVPVIDLGGLSRCAPRTYRNWSIIGWSCARIIAFIRILYDFC